MALDGDTVVIGEPVAGGQARVYVDASSWTLITTITSGSLGDAAFGYAVALDSGALVIGDPLDSPATLGGSVYATGRPSANIATTLDFELDLATGAPASVTVAPNGIAVNEINRSGVAQRGATSNVSASSITTIGVDDTALAQIAIGSTPLSAIVLDSAPLSAIPLSAIDVRGAGGWQALLAGTLLAHYPLTTVTFGEALRDPDVAGRVAALPLSAIDVDGTPAVGDSALGDRPRLDTVVGDPAVGDRRYRAESVVRGRRRPRPCGPV